MTKKFSLIVGGVLVLLGIWQIWSPEKIQGLIGLIVGLLVLYKSKDKPKEKQPLPMGTM